MTLRQLKYVMDLKKQLKNLDTDTWKLTYEAVKQENERRNNKKGKKK